jgi:A118 family predicted phage portal protein
MELYNSIQNELSKKNINVQVGNMYDMMAIWKSWYRGNVNDFHYYNATLADGSTIKCERLTMNMPKKVCEDFAKLLWSEKTEITLDNKTKTKKLWDVLDSKKNNFSVSFPIAIEKAFALGTGCLVEYKVNGETIIEYIDGDNCIVYENTNTYITGFITVDQFSRGMGSKKMYYTHLTYHEYKNGVYTKYNELYASKNESNIGREIDFASMFPEVENPVIYETDTPHFQFIKPNIANNFDMNSPLGLSIFANQIDKFKALDIKYDSFANEFELGKKRILVDRTALKSATQVNTDGTITNVSYFDRNDKAYVAINGMDGQPVKEIDMSIRHQEHIDSINADLNYIGAGVGFDPNYYSFSDKGLKTATEVISDNSDTYRTKVHHQIIIRDVLYDLVKSVCFLEGIETKSINIVFDDSIIEDKNAEIERGLKLLDKNIISKETFMTKYLGYDESQVAEEKEKIMTDLTYVIQMLDSMVIDKEKAIDLLFGDSITNDEKLRMIANGGEIGEPIIDEEDTKEKIVEE